MSERRYSPGPWKVKENGGRGKLVGIYAADDTGWFIAEEVLEKNSNLIAAAPELLEALEDIVAAYSSTVKKCGHDFFCKCPGDKARAAIKKALGG